MSAAGRRFEESLLSFIWFLVVLDVPLSWRKTTGGFTYQWVGLEIDRKSWTLGISERRAAWLLNWLSRVIAARAVLMRELREALGRMVFVYGALQHDRPFLGPLFAFLNTRPAGSFADLPLYIITVLCWLHARLKSRRGAQICDAPAVLGSLFRVDAKAEGMSVAIGGWSPVRDESGLIRTDLSPWFSITLDEQNAPWAFARGLPARAITTLELLASTVALVLLVPADRRGAGMATVTGLTDSQVASKVVSRGMTTVFPLCCVTMELAAQLEKRNLELNLEWIPRDSNAEADRLADGDSSGFRVENRCGTTIDKVDWLVLPGLLKAGREFHAREAGRANVVLPEVADTSQPRKRLKEREPW